MGFRKGSYAKVWGVDPKSDTLTVLRISISRKNQDGEYVQDFSGFVGAYGTANAKKASMLSEGSRIKLGDVDVTTSYNKETKTGFTNFKLFSFEDAEFHDSPADGSMNEPDPGDLEPPTDDRLPF